MRRLSFRQLWPLLFAPLGFLLTVLAQAFPQANERIFSSGLYKLFTGIGGRIFSVLPLSIAQILLLVLLISIVVYIVLSTRQNKWSGFFFALLQLLKLASVGYFLFIIFCGLNYYRLPFAQHAQLSVHPSSVQELALLCTELVNDANTLAEQVQRDANGLMQSSFENHASLANVVAQAYEKSAQSHPSLAGYTPRAKSILFPRMMSYLHLVGIYIPFTFEANVNTDVAPYLLPSTMAHELAHYKGFMREDEANFIAYLVCRDSENPELAYSGTMLAFVHTSNALYYADRELYFSVIEDLDPRVRLDQIADAAYWKDFEGPAAQVSANVNNIYLKSNRQKTGIKSYGQMVDLLLADYRKRDGQD